MILDILRDLPAHLATWTSTMGPWIYVLLFAIIFAETGLVVTPFLPGDSLLFALGALTAIENGLDFTVLAIVLIAAALIGDAVNYNVGRWLGPKLFSRPNSKILNPAHLKRTQDFYLAYGGKTIVLARFLPILRTYAPFAAGLARLPFAKFFLFSVSGGIVWILSFLTLGHFFANSPEIKANFHYVIVAIIVISLAPVAIEFYRARAARRGPLSPLNQSAKQQETPRS